MISCSGCVGWVVQQVETKPCAHQGYGHALYTLYWRYRGWTLAPCSGMFIYIFSSVFGRLLCVCVCLAAGCMCTCHVKALQLESNIFLQAQTATAVHFFHAQSVGENGLMHGQAFSLFAPASTSVLQPVNCPQHDTRSISLLYRLLQQVAV